MTEDLTKIKASLEQAETVIEDYQTIVADLQARLDRAEESLPGRINAVVLIITFVLAWAGVSQIGLLVQGLEIARRD